LAVLSFERGIPRQLFRRHTISDANAAQRGQLGRLPVEPGL
jgi:hypothetical protein